MTNPSIEEMDFLNKTVRVIIDRPLGSQHPKYAFSYPLNYGYIPDTLAKDGAEIDAYIIGIDKPVKVFCGLVKAIIIRLNDCENKLIVTPEEYEVSEEEIRLKTYFQEQYFKIQIKLPTS